MPPRRLAGDGNGRARERTLRASLNDAEEQARTVGAHMVMIGILPTLRREHMTAEALSANPRYALLNEQIFAARGEDLRHRDRRRRPAGGHHRHHRARGGLHQHPVPPAGQPGRSSPRTGTPPRSIAGIQVALGANSPLLFGRELWRETRIPLFEQATDTRSEEIKAQGVRPRVWFGERWITRVFDLFEENVRYFPALLPICDDEDPARDAGRGGDAPSWPSCGCTTAPSTAGTGRSTTWSRGRPHLRVENRVLPAGPTVVDTHGQRARSTTGWSGRWPRRSGRCGRRCRSARPRRTSTPAPGTASTRSVYWPGLGYVPVTELVLRRLLPLAHEGLDRVGGLGRRARPAARHHRAALPDRPQRRDLAGGRRCTRWRPRAIGPAGGAARDAPAVPAADAREPPGARVADPLDGAGSPPTRQSRLTFDSLTAVI